MLCPETVDTSRRGGRRVSWIGFRSPPGREAESAVATLTVVEVKVVEDGDAGLIAGAEVSAVDALGF